MFTWKPIYSELAGVLLAWRSRQNELIAILHAAGEQGVPVSTLQDEDKKGQKFPLQVIDPFTFFAFFNRGTKPVHRQKLLSLIKDKLGLTSPVPDDFDGIPIMSSTNSRFFSHQMDREPDAIDTLWAFAKAIVEQSPEAVDGELFARARRIKQVGLGNLTMGMFWMRPDNYLAVDSRNRALLKKSGIEPDISDWPSYLNLLQQARIQFSGVSWAELSQRAYGSDSGGGGASEKGYWLFQANPKVFDLVGALKARKLQTWQVNQHRKEIHPGDRVVLWLSGPDAGIYGLATVTSAVGDLKESTEEASFHIESVDTSKPFIGVTLQVDGNFYDNPITKEDLLEHKHTKAAPVGRQGTNFPLTVKQFNAIESMKSTGNEGRRFWLYSPGEHARFWKECLDKKIMVIGYDELGDYSKYESQSEIEQTIKKLWKVKNRPSNHSRAVWEFANVMQPGDVVITKRGRSEYVGYGIVEGGYQPDNSRPEYKNVRRVNWLKQGSWTADFKLALKTLTDVTKYPDYVEKLKKLIGITLEPQAPIQSETFLPALNVILYGPPGTGKTFNTIERAVRIIESDFTGDHDAHKARFDVLRRKGQIEFITFHQSYSYEDFVEGLRPVVDPEEESSQARYQYKPGVFKRLAVQALFDCLKPASAEAHIVSFEALWKRLVEQIEIDPDKKYPGLTEKTSYRISLTERGNLEGKNVLSSKTFLCTRSILEKVFAAKPKSKSVSSSDVMEVVVRGCHSHFVAAMFNELKRVENTEFAGKGQPPTHTFSEDQKTDIVQAYLRQSDASPYVLKPSTEWPPYVLVVDEINRGNISKILGELITLIESDKRLGAEHSLVVTLPYTGDHFVVPGNLHILGTMNTADKSIALVDVALRRRFEFEESRPDFNYCAKLSPAMRDVLETLNRRICLRKDRDHQIGHSYLMKVANEQEFNRVFARHIIPLLQEYFFNDWEGLRFVLGEQGKQSGAFIKPLADSSSGEARTKWQWCTDIGEGINFLQTLVNNYKPG